MHVTLNTCTSVGSKLDVRQANVSTVTFWLMSWIQILFKLIKAYSLAIYCIDKIKKLLYGQVLLSSFLFQWVQIHPSNYFVRFFFIFQHKELSHKHIWPQTKSNNQHIHMKTKWAISTLPDSFLSALILKAIILCMKIGSGHARLATYTL